MHHTDGQLERPRQPVIYAELLPNIRSVSVFVHLHTPRSSSTTLNLVDDGEAVVLQHGGITLQLALPVRVIHAMGKALPISSTSSYDMTLRLQPDLNALSELLDLQSDHIVPWSASSLQDCLDIQCLKCSSTIIVGSNFRTWQDLPSANWAEMMDFWHCHKPVDHKHRQQDSHAKGYDAGNVLTAKCGIGYVDVTTLLLSPEDCRGVKVSSELLCKHTPLACTDCENILGVVDGSASGWRLFKHSLSVTFTDLSLPRKYLPEQWIAAQLLSTVESQASRKFVIKQESTSGHALFIWLFTPDLWFSATEAGRSETVTGRATKVMYKIISDLEETALSNQVGVEEIELPVDMHQMLQVALSANQLLLPLSAKQFKDWNVSLLRRFAA